MEDSTSMCSISRIQPSHEGWYCCVASNECGSVQECAWLEVDSKLQRLQYFVKLYINILATPVFTLHPQSLNIKHGSKKVSLNCSAHAYGFDEVQYDWRKYQPKNNKWKRPSGRATGTKSSKLTFVRITKDDEGTYSCIAISNDGQAISNNATIAVYGECYCLV